MIGWCWGPLRERQAKDHAIGGETFAKDSEKPCSLIQELLTLYKRLRGRREAVMFE